MKVLCAAWRSPSPLAGLVMVAALAGGVASCVPRPARQQEVGGEVRALRYRAGLAEREARGVAVDADVLLWAETEATGRLPGAEARLLLVAPDAFRLRVRSAFGTALDLAGSGDSLTAYLPSRRLGLRIVAERDSLGLKDAGALVFHMASATWRPPPEAWASGTPDADLLRLAWLEDGDSLEVAVSADGLPVWVKIARPGHGPLRALYRGWDRSSGTAWPSVLEFMDEDAAIHMTCKVSRLRFATHADRGRMTVTIPPGASQLGLEELHEALRRLGEL